MKKVNVKFKIIAEFENPLMPQKIHTAYETICLNVKLEIDIFFIVKKLLTSVQKKHWHSFISTIRIFMGQNG